MPVTATLRYTSLQMKTVRAGSDDKGNLYTFSAPRLIALSQDDCSGLRTSMMWGLALAGLQDDIRWSPVRRLNEVQLAAE